MVVPSEVYDRGDAVTETHVWEWATLALNLSGTGFANDAYLDATARLSGNGNSFAITAMAPPPPPPRTRRRRRTLQALCDAGYCTRKQGHGYLRERYYMFIRTDA